MWACGHPDVLSTPRRHQHDNSLGPRRGLGRPSQHSPRARPPGSRSSATAFRRPPGTPPPASGFTGRLSQVPHRSPVMLAVPTVHVASSGTSRSTTPTTTDSHPVIAAPSRRCKAPVKPRILGYAVRLIRTGNRGTPKVGCSALVGTRFRGRAGQDRRAVVCSSVPLLPERPAGPFHRLHDVRHQAYCLAWPGVGRFELPHA